MMRTDGPEAVRRRCAGGAENRESILEANARSEKVEVAVVNSSARVSYAEYTDAASAWMHKSGGASSCARLEALFVLNSLHVGGSETKTVRLVNAMLGRNLMAGIAYLNDSDALLEQLDPRVPVWPLHRRGKFSVAAMRGLRQIIRRNEPSVVFSVNMYPALYVALATAALRNRPLIVGSLNTTTLAREDEWQRAFYRPFLKRFDKIVFGCELQRAEWSSHLRLSQERSVVIYNGVDLARFAPVSDDSATAARLQFDIPSDRFVLGTVGRLAPEKNQAVLIDTLAEMRRRGIDAHLLLVGDGPEKSRLQGLVRARRMEACVTFAGAQKDVRPLLSAMNVFVLPSTHVETFSNAALEAMAMSRPVILGRIGGAAEMVRNEIDGFTMDCDSLKVKLPHLLIRLHDDPHLCARLGRAARERVELCFSLHKMVDDFCALTRGSPCDPGVP